jgi:SAM-dependent methyltransferase
VSTIEDFEAVSKKFGEIYATNFWHFGSGEGSLAQLTTGYRDFLTAFIAKSGVRTVVDIGCGDWQFSKLIDWSNVSYLGIDVDQGLVDRNNKEFGGPNISFVKMNIFEGPPAADLMVCKDVMQHWTNGMVTDFAPFMGRYKYALLTNCADPADKRNLPIAVGKFRPLDLTAAPFQWPVAKVFEFSGPSWRKETLLWSRSFADECARFSSGFTAPKS